MKLRILASLALAVSLGSAQVAVSPYGKPQYFDASGRPLSGGFLYTYAAGTTTLQSTYTDSTGHVANQDPIPLDSSGSPPFGVFLSTTTAYKFVLTDSFGATRWTLDGITAGGSTGGASIGSVTIPSGSSLTMQSGSFTSIGTNLVPDTANVRTIGTSFIPWQAGYFNAVSAGQGVFSGVSTSVGPNTFGGTTTFNGPLVFSNSATPYQIQCSANCGINNTVLVGQTSTDIPAVNPSIIAAGQVYAATSPSNSSYIGLQTSPAVWGALVVGRSGSGAYLPMAFLTNNQEQMSIDVSGNLTLYNGTGNFPRGVQITSPAGSASTALRLSNAFIQPAQTFFSSLSAFGSPQSGSILYCIDCAVSTPCTGSSTGALAVFTGTVWSCK